MGRHRRLCYPLRVSPVSAFLEARAAIRRFPLIRQTCHAALELPFAGRLLRRAVNAVLARSGGEQWFDTTVGWMLLDPLWDAHYFRFGDAEPDTTRALRSLLREGMSVWDVGAHAGYYTLLCAAAVGPSGRVLAVEADPDNAQRCRRNIERNELAHAAVLHCAAWSADGSIRFTRSTAGRMSGKPTACATPGTLAEAEQIAVPARTLDSIAGSHSLPDLIKMDVEGAELEVLRGAPQILSARRPVLLIELHSGELHRRVAEWLGGFGYSVRELTSEPVYPLHCLASVA